MEDKIGENMTSDTEKRSGEQEGGEERTLPTQEEVLREWIETREESRKEAMENYFKGMYPMMFVAGFFLLATAYQEGRRIRYLGVAGAGMPSLILVTVSFILGAGLVFAGARIMKKQKQDRMREMEERVKAMQAQQGEKENAGSGQKRPRTIAEKAAMTARTEEAAMTARAEKAAMVARTEEAAMTARAEEAAMTAREEETEHTGEDA